MKQAGLDTRKIPKEVQLMLDVLKENDENAFCESEYSTADWEKFLELSLHHRLHPILYLKLKQLQTNQIPASVMNFLHHHYKRNTFKMLQFSSVTEKVSILLSNHQIPVLLLKGPALTHHLYGDISHRTSSDLDFLIPIEKLAETEKLLLQEGFRKDDYIKTVLNDWKWRHHHVTYFHPEQRIKIEMHWRLNPGPGKEPAFKELWKRKTKSELTKSPVFLLGNEDLLLFLASHGARHGWSRLRWLHDIQYILHQQLDWKKIDELARKYHYSRSLGQAFLLAGGLFQVKITPEIKQFTMKKYAKNLAQQAIFYMENQINLHTDPVPEDVAIYHKRHLYALKSMQQKCIFRVSFLYPYPEDEETLPLPKKYHFLYFPLRPVLWAWRKTKEYALPKGTF